MKGPRSRHKFCVLRVWECPLCQKRASVEVHLVNRDRKKSEMGYSRSGLDPNPNPLTGKLDEIKELKLPKVQNRYNRTKEKGVKHNQNSLRCYKIFEC